MKIAVSYDNTVVDLDALKAISTTTVSNGDIMIVGPNGYTYRQAAIEGGVKPNDKSDEDSGRWIEDPSVIKPTCYIVGDSYDFGSNNATEITDIVSVEAIGLKLIDQATPGWYDRKCVRDRLKGLVYSKMQVSVPADVDDPVKWDLLTDAEKDIAAHWFLVGKHDFQDEVFDDTQNNRRYWKLRALNYRDWTQSGRNERMKMMESIVFCGIQDVADAFKIIEELDQISTEEEFKFDVALTSATIPAKLTERVNVKGIRNLYKDGIESKASDGQYSLRDFINSTSGTIYENDGFRSYTYATRGGYTIDSLADELLTVIDGTW